jgi:hypothetical protein
LLLTDDDLKMNDPDLQLDPIFSREPEDPLMKEFRTY